VSRAYKWAQLSRAQQDDARDVRQRLWDRGLSATVSQIARHYDEAVAWQRGELTVAEFARVVDAVEVGPAPVDVAGTRRALAEWAANDRRRDDVVLAAIEAGVSKTEVHELTGIARTTIDRIAADG
jgi:hypothetical protein